MASSKLGNKRIYNIFGWDLWFVQLDKVVFISDIYI